MYRRTADNHARCNMKIYRHYARIRSLSNPPLPSLCSRRLTAHRSTRMGLYSFDQEGVQAIQIDFGYADALTTADRLTFRFMVKA